jgi:hypothetical protein
MEGLEMAQNRPGKAQFKVLFWRKWQTEGPAKTIGSLALAIVRVSGKILMGAGKRAFDFRQPALPGLDPSPGEDLPALPPSTILKNWKKERRPPSAWHLGGVERLLSRCTDWRSHPIWNWLSGGGLKGLLGARRFWAIALRHFLDGIGRVGWTFRVAAIEPLKFATEKARLMSSAFADFRRFRDWQDEPMFYRPPRPVLRRIFWHGVFPPALGGLFLLAEDLILDRTVGLPTFLYDFSALAAMLAMIVPVLVFWWCLDGLP